MAFKDKIQVKIVFSYPFINLFRKVKKLHQFVEKVKSIDIVFQHRAIAFSNYRRALNASSKEEESFSFWGNCIPEGMPGIKFFA